MLSSLQDCSPDSFFEICDKSPQIKSVITQCLIAMFKLLKDCNPRSWQCLTDALQISNRLKIWFGSHAMSYGQWEWTQAVEREESISDNSNIISHTTLAYAKILPYLATFWLKKILNSLHNKQSLQPAFPSPFSYPYYFLFFILICCKSAQK